MTATQIYAGRFPEYRAAYTDALIAAGGNGINLFDAAIHYRNQRSERCIGATLKQLDRGEIVCTKAPFFTPGAVPAFLQEEDVVGVASGTWRQGRVQHMPDSVARLPPGLDTDAQRAIRFTRSTPGISATLVGMGRREHVIENLGVARVPPAAREQYARLYP